MNCWQFQKCGRGVGAANMCPAAADTKLHGKNRGANGGRYCWRVPDTLRDGKPQGSFGQKLPVCSRCEFYLLVKAEEGKDFTV